MQNIWNCDGKIELIWNRYQQFIKDFYFEEDAYFSQLEDFFQLQKKGEVFPFLYERELLDIKKNLRNSYCQKHFLEYQKSIYEEILSFFKNIIFHYRLLLQDFENSILTLHGYFQLQKIYSSYQELLNLLCSSENDVVQNKDMIFAFLGFIDLQILELSHEDYWKKCSNTVFDYQENYVLQFSSFSDILNSSILGEYSYFDYVSCCENYYALQLENEKVSQHEKSLFESSLVDIFRFHPEFLDHSDKDVFLQIKKQLFQMMKESSNENETDECIQLIYKINTEYLNL